MDRHAAYQIASEQLTRYREMAVADLTALVGTRSCERVARADAGEFIVEIEVKWADERREQIRVTAIVDSPSTFRLERIEESVLVDALESRP